MLLEIMFLQLLLSKYFTTSIKHTQRVIVSELKGVVYENLNTFASHSQHSPTSHKNINPMNKISMYSKFVSSVQIGTKHTIISDLKQAEYGLDLGPSPKELCLSALGSCTVMTIRTFYENTKKLNPLSDWNSTELTNISVTLDEVSGGHSHVPQGINMVIDLTGNVTKTQQERLLKASSNCPVKQMLNSNLIINAMLGN